MPGYNSLLSSSGNEQVDRLTLGLLELLELLFPGRILSCYFQGSCADQTLMQLSHMT